MLQIMNAHLFIRTGPNSGEIHPLGSGPVIAGRARSCGIRLDDPFVSREHFRIDPREKRFWVVDMGSMNCTAVNGIPTQTKQLDHGDEIHIGSTRMLFFAGVGSSTASERNSEISRTLMTHGATAHERFEMIGSSEPMRKLYAMIDRVAPIDSTVLIIGESGTGKELVARAIHQGSKHGDGPLVNVNCAAIPGDLAESELFGHEKGAFTGAHAQRLGKFELANNGTLFLDEIGELSPDCQAKLLRVLEEKRVTRVGGDRDYRITVRVIAATHQDLHGMVSSGRFRQDLLYRLEVVRLNVPALRDRSDDVVVLSRHFLDYYREKVGRKVDDYSPAALQKLKDYDWPGNVRELKNVIERAVILGAGTTVETEDIQLPESHAYRRPISGEHRGVEFPPLEDVLRSAGKRHIERAVQLSDGNKTKAAELLGIPRSSIYDVMKRYGIHE
jgi:transcriptional regulator with GAF, ATPase, and Fis domain